MSNKKLIMVLLGVAIVLLAGYTSSFSQATPAEKFSFGSQVSAPTDTHCVAKPGDINGDNLVTLTDLLAFVHCIYIIPIRPCFEPQCRGDLDGNGMQTISDIIYFVNYLFRGGPAPVKSGVCCL